MNSRSTDATLVSSAPNITYLTGYSGFSTLEREAYLLIVSQHQVLTDKTPGVIGYILTDGRYTEAVRNIPHFTLLEISPINSLEKILIMLIKKHKIKKLGIEENNLTVSEYRILKKHFSILRHVNLNGLRSIKEKDEILAIEKACRIGDKAFDYIIGKIKKGVTEKELAFEIEFFIKKANAAISFPPIVAFGKNTAIPHHQPTNRKLLTNNFVLLDFGAKVNNYCSDMTRTVFFGKPTAEQKRMYQTVLEAQKKAIDHLGWWRGSDLDSSEVDRVARDYIISKGYPTIPHSLGHGIGLQVHESPTLSPKSKDILKPGMVFSVEPGIYIPGFGGVRIEDLVVLEPSGPRLLTKSLREFLEL
ncbi:MAG: aminopeptidase P family protein [Candidatus Levybacteria bacterium]|nr:aminopeptidase P family protein [Candidatus Levybacteria bacterium]